MGERSFAREVTKFAVQHRSGSGEGQPLVNDVASGDVAVSSTANDAFKPIGKRVVLKLAGLGGLLLVVFFAVTTYTQHSVSSALQSFVLANEASLVLATPQATLSQKYTLKAKLSGDLVGFLLPSGYRVCDRPITYDVGHYRDSNLLAFYKVVVYKDFFADVTIQIPVRGEEGHSILITSSCDVLSQVRSGAATPGDLRHFFTLEKGIAQEFYIQPNRRVLFAANATSKSGETGFADVLRFRNRRDDPLVTIGASLPPSAGNDGYETELIFGIRYKYFFSATHQLSRPDIAYFALYIDLLNTL